MAEITIRYFASIREAFGKSDEVLRVADDATVGDVWENVVASVPGIQLPGKVLCSVNQRHADFNAGVSDGDEVAFFPPVTGG